MSVKSRYKLLSQPAFAKICDTARLCCLHRIRFHSSIRKDHACQSRTSTLPKDDEATLYVHVSISNGLM